MDITLEFADTYLFDHIYAYLLPATPIPYRLSDPHASNVTADGHAWSSHTWQYKPAHPSLAVAPTDAAYQSAWTRDNIYRQAMTLYLITWLAGAAIYFIVSGLSYVFVFDKTAFQHPKFLKNQIRMEIATAWNSMPWIAVLTTPFFLFEVRGFSKLYNTTAEGPGRWYDIAQFPFFLIFTDFCIYWIHRGLHHPRIYKYLHKAHHKWIIPTPFASVAFHPVDGFSQSLPYHLFPYIFPLQKFAYLALFVFVQFWTVFIHDGEYVANNRIINGAACHTMHHLYFSVNYGQYTTLWDRLGGSYRKPNDELFRRETKMGQTEWDKQAREMEKMVKEVEGHDDRAYDQDAPHTVSLSHKKDL